ncbi:hypothetical protein ASPSYDRAFT_271343 [Aspergillus sydowii CBS 593.65]|uniref:Uncharacterized protein n=1 Tax=Aspergillus sydowii CBS 593.65 TaxID=1036612 RepID=A0A1L9TX52_9EURO|nr:uncharacterized protein ASPSYDRAFT_271343 [Aspergillus sydowii CBS 593.65]OJJ63853.1 hypothetical protein ASPSYDRAFT_271343 [Aspergillus sydowii CBS 593.65]
MKAYRAKKSADISSIAITLVLHNESMRITIRLRIKRLTLVIGWTAHIGPLYSAAHTYIEGRIQ